MISLILLVTFPFALLALPLGMERVERPLRADALGEQVAAALAAPRAEDVERLVSERVSPPVQRYWRRHAGAPGTGRRLLRRPARAQLARR